MDNKSMVQLDKTTLKKIKDLKITKLETYNEIILRLIENSTLEKTIK